MEVIKNMKKLYTWMGAGYKLHECKLDDEYQEALEADYLEPVLCHLIDTNQCYYIDANDIHESDLNEWGELEGYVYIDNTASEVNPGCYYVLIENMKTI